MSRSKSSKPGLMKRMWNVLFKPSMPIYQDEPKRPSAARKPGSGAGGKGTVKKKLNTAAKKQSKSLDGLTAGELGERIGFVDKAGVVRLKATSKEVGRVELDQMGDTTKVLGDFVELYRGYESQLIALKDKGQDISVVDMVEVEKLEAAIIAAPGLGDAAKLNSLLDELRTKASANTTKQRAESVKLLQKIDALPKADGNGEIHWTNADKELEQLSEELKRTVNLGGQAQVSLNDRFDATVRAYKDRKYNFYNDHDGNRQLKEQLIRKAENLTFAADVADAQATFENLAKQWRSIGPVVDGEEAVLIERLEDAKKEFVIANADRLSEQEERRGHLMTRKADMALELESLIMSDDVRQLQNAVSTHSATLEQIHRHLGSDEQTLDLETKLAAVDEKAQVLRAKAGAAKKAAELEAKSIIERVDVLSDASANGIAWKAADAELKELQATAKTLKGLPRDVRSAMDQKIRDGFKDFIANRTVFFEKMDEQREENEARKRALINDLPFYKNGATSVELVAHLNTSMGAWKKVGPAGRDVNDALWDEYRQVRDDLYERVRELRVLEKDDFAAKLAGVFAHKRETLNKLEAEVAREEFLIENTSDKKKADKMRADLKRQKKRVLDLQSDVLDIQRKLSKMSAEKSKEKAKQVAEPEELKQVDQIADTGASETEAGETEAGETVTSEEVSSS